MTTVLRESERPFFHFLIDDGDQDAKPQISIARDDGTTATFDGIRALIESQYVEGEPDGSAHLSRCHSLIVAMIDDAQLALDRPSDEQKATIASLPIAARVLLSSKVGGQLFQELDRRRLTEELFGWWNVVRLEEQAAQEVAEREEREQATKAGRADERAAVLGAALQRREEDRPPQ